MGINSTIDLRTNVSLLQDSEMKSSGDKKKATTLSNKVVMVTFVKNEGPLYVLLVNPTAF